MTEKKPGYQVEDGGIVRVVKDGKYFVASNEPFNDIRISWETRGLMGYLLSKPDQWQIRMLDLLKKGPAKNFKLRRMLSEARLFGYMTRTRTTNPDGTFTWITNVYESPSLNTNPAKGFVKNTSSVRKSTTGSSTRLPTSGKPRHVLKTKKPVKTEEDYGATTEYMKNLEHRAETIAKYFRLSVLRTSNEDANIAPLMKQIIVNCAKEYEDESWYEPAFTMMVKNCTSPTFTYVETILENWKKYGFGKLPPEFEKKNGDHNGNKNGNSRPGKNGNSNRGGRTTPQREGGSQPSNSAGLSADDQAVADRINARRREERAEREAAKANV